MGDEQQYDETQTGDAKIRDLGREYFPLSLVMPGDFIARSCAVPGVCSALFCVLPGVCSALSCAGFVVRCTGHQGGSWQTKVL